MSHYSLNHYSEIPIAGERNSRPQVSIDEQLAQGEGWKCETSILCEQWILHPFSQTPLLLAPSV